MKNHTIKTLPGNKLLISGKCVFTGVDYSVTVDYNEWKNWQNGMLIQQAMPTLSADNREFLISGISPAGWITNIW